jgi:DNA invertase Pin-like site-specific DNA recombinase
MENKTQVATLARISTADQHSIELQQTDMRNYCKSRGWSIIEEIAEEISGAAKSRPGRDKIMQLARARKIDGVIVWRLNRFGRSSSELIFLLNELQALGVAFTSIQESLDFSTPTGRLMASLLAVFAEFEREILIENVNAGIRKYREKNRTWGRPRKIMAAANAARMLADKKPVAEIISATGLSRAAIYRIKKTILF